MHPPLERPHPECGEIIQGLYRCHEEYKVGKWFGACNSVKDELDWCLRKEKETKRDLNLLKAREFDNKFAIYLEQKKLKEGK